MKSLKLCEIQGCFDQRLLFLKAKHAQEQGEFWIGDIDEKFGESKGDSTKDGFF